MSRFHTPIRAALLGVAVGIAAPLAAQSAPEEIVVTGRSGTVPDSVRSLSQAVSYADLDLSTDAGKKEIRHRIELTARFLCDKLGAPTGSVGVAPPCRQDAAGDAMRRLGTVEENFAPRGTTWARGPAWQPPYPANWATLYP
jgi:UrcA family protein